MKRWQQVLVGTALLVVAGAGTVGWVVRTAEPRLRRQLELWLSDRLNSDVALASVSVRLFPSVRLEGTGLAASGNVLGTLERLATNGSPRPPRWASPPPHRAGCPMTATFEAAFDGSSGDLFLSSLLTTVGQSAFNTTGSITRQKGVRGRHVHLAVSTPDPVELADVLRLLVDGQRPPASGRLTLDAAIEMAPGEADVIDRLDVAGTFGVTGATFVNRAVQEKVDDLSRRGRGRPDDTTIRGVGVAMRGRVAVRKTHLTLQDIRFAVPGAEIDAAGRYGLASERLDFRGVVRLDVGMSRTLTGAKRVLLRPLDPLLSKDGAGTRLVLEIRGRRSDPTVDIDIGASLRGRR